MYIIHTLLYTHSHTHSDTHTLIWRIIIHMNYAEATVGYKVWRKRFEHGCNVHNEWTWWYPSWLPINLIWPRSISFDFYLCYRIILWIYCVTFKTVLARAAVKKSLPGVLKVYEVYCDLYGTARLWCWDLVLFRTNSGQNSDEGECCTDIDDFRNGVGIKYSFYQTSNP